VRIEQALESAMRKARAAEVAFHQQRMSSAEYEDDKLKRVSASQSSDVSIRVIVDGKVGWSSTTDPNALEPAVARALELAQFGNEASFDFPGPSAGAQVKTYDAEVERTPREELVAVGGEMLERIKAYNPEIKVGCETSWVVSERRLVNSSGLDITSKDSLYSGGVGGVLVRGTDILFAGRWHSWRAKELDAKKLGNDAISDFRHAERIAPVSSKNMPVIFTPRGVRVLLASLLMGVDGKSVFKGDSPLAKRLGERIASPEFSLTDDATIAYAPESGRHDGEGVPRRRNEIVREGVLTCFLYDLETAAKAGAVSTGNGYGCAPSNVVVAPGKTSFAEMAKGTAEGIVVESVMGLGQSNIMNGDFSVNIALGYKVEKGEIVGRVKDAMLAGNVYDALTRIEAIGSEPEWFGSTCSPAVLVGEVSVVAGR